MDIVAPRFAQILLPLPIRSSFTYKIPAEMSGFIKPGFRVVVPFGRNKYYTGIVESISSTFTCDYELKEIAWLPDKEPIVRFPQMKLWQWIADYYMCTPGEVYKAAIPSALKLESETVVELNPDFDDEQLSALSDDEILIYQALVTGGKMSANKLAARSQIKHIHAILGAMIDRGIVIVSEKLIERYRPIRLRYLSVAIKRGDSDALHNMFKAVKGAKAQERTLMTLMQLSDFMRLDRPVKEVSRKTLIDTAKSSASIIKELKIKGLINETIRETSRYTFEGLPTGELPKLSQAQAKALDEIHKSFVDKSITLLHGVTSSGKTEVYMHLIDYVLKQGRQVLYMVPEIALTTQLTERIQRVFGSKVIVYHSKFSDQRRVETWRHMMASTEPCVVIGARSSVFLPFASLGLVIVDEEHESSYKQYDPAPRYNGRDVGMILASMHGAKTLLGSATPAVETFYKAQTGKFGLVSLTERYKGIAMPVIDIVDMGLSRKRRDNHGAIAHSTMLNAREALENNRQVIFFHNRRGFSPFARCRQCAYVPRCASCDVSLTYHRHHNQMECHYCGTPAPLPKVCPVCGSTDIDIIGYGTERVEDDIERYFPGNRILRMDLDTTRNKDDYENLIDAFSAHKADILIGTQMVTKGLDFKDVSTVIVVNADTIINMPDFRSSERAFNMLEQVAGRAGRRADIPGRVIIQTYTPSHPLLKYVSQHDYDHFVHDQLIERRRFNYPPFARIIYVYIKHRDAMSCNEISERYARRLRDLFGTRVFGPETPHVSRVQNMYIRKVMLKFEPQASMTKAKEYLNVIFEEFRTEQSNRGVVIYYDVDPQ